MDLRVIVDGPLAGAWNMAVDEALLESAAQGVATLRFYQWTEPTLSLGYFQAHADRQTHAASRQAALVRRSTGGGAIVHDHELTYSLSVPAATRSARETRHLYDLMHQSAVTLLQSVGVPATMWGPGSSIPQKAEPFLCFQRRAVGDVVAEQHKILGSAQRRWRGGLLQHGSLLLQTSAAAPEVVGLEPWLRSELDPSELGLQWQREVGTKLAVNLQPAELTARERQRAESIQAEKFSNPAWTERR